MVSHSQSIEPKYSKLFGHAETDACSSDFLLIDGLSQAQRIGNKLAAGVWHYCQVWVISHGLIPLTGLFKQASKDNG